MDRVAQPVSTTIIIYGSSLFLDSVELALRKNGRSPLLRLCDLHTPLPLNGIPAGMIIYDQEQIQATAVFQLLTNYPGWRLVGLSASKENLLSIHSEKSNGRLLADLIDMIQR